MIRNATENDFNDIYNVINNASIAYKGIIPAHAYVITTERKKGIGTILIHELLKDSKKPILIGTWKAAHWAISFYERHGFFYCFRRRKKYFA